MKLAERVFRCDACGLIMDRDRNAAANLAAWAERARAWTAKRAARSPMPLEGKALAVGLTAAKPAPWKEEPKRLYATKRGERPRSLAVR